MIPPDDFLAQAEAWIKLPAEVDWRSAASRGYYAAFHVARLLLQDLGFVVPHGPQAHAHMWLRLSNCGEPTTSAAGADLNELQRFRNRADYDIHRDVIHTDAATAVGMARRTIERLADGRMKPTRSAINAAMRDYERNLDFCPF
jgi:hypothetical protein